MTIPKLFSLSSSSGSTLLLAFFVLAACNPKESGMDPNLKKDAGRIDTKPASISVDTRPSTEPGIQADAAIAPADAQPTEKKDAWMPGDSRAVLDTQPMPGQEAGANPTDGLMADATADAPQTLDAGPKAPGKNGEACNNASECQTGHCALGVCCDQACTDGCWSCKQVHSGKPDGICAPVGSGKDPYESCKDETDLNECGMDGYCNGAGACRKVNTSHVCTPAECNDGKFTPVSTCDGNGSCKAVTAEECGPSKCVPSEGCKKNCIGDADCGAGAYCDAGTHQCSVKKIQGKACKVPTECTSGYCTEGICCNSACTDKCKSCTQALTGQTSGTCQPVKVGEDDPKDLCKKDPNNPCGNDGTCDGNGNCDNAGTAVNCGAARCDENGSFFPAVTCNGKGACSTPVKDTCENGKYVCDPELGCEKNCAADLDCTENYFCNTTSKKCETKKNNGAKCSKASECTNDHCVDGFCCNTLCADKCYGCSSELTGKASGTCNPVKEKTDPKNSCNPEDGKVCGQDGFCDGNGACRKHGNEKTCAQAKCETASATEQKYTAAKTCNGAGQCTGPAAITCGIGFACTEADGCDTDCTTDNDCADPNQYFCENKKCIQKKEQGKACKTNNECKNNRCIDGYCCNSDCQQECKACNVLGHEGTCDSVPKDAADGNCLVTQDTCGAKGCDGYGKCAYPATTLPCGQGDVCTNNTLKTFRCIGRAPSGGENSCKETSQSCGTGKVCSTDQRSCVTAPPPAVTLTDGDGKVYQTVKIGTLYWITQNLSTTKYSDGNKAINDGNTKAQWAYGNQEAKVASFGRLYSWAAVNSNNPSLCPSGWRVPSDADWQSVNAGTLASFNPQFGGYRQAPVNPTDELFLDAGSKGFWWTSTASSPPGTPAKAHFRSLDNKPTIGLTEGEADQGNGYSVRCVRAVN